MSRVEVITGPMRRRRWSEEQKQSIVAESFAPGGSVSEVARRADICPAQIYRWRQELRAAVQGFAPVLIGPAELSPVSMPVDAPSGEPVIEVELADRMRVRIPNSASVKLVTAVLSALSRR